MKQLVDRHTVKLIFDYCCVQARNSLYKVISIVNTAYVHVRTDGIERTSNRILQQSPLADASQRPSYRFLDRRHHIISTDKFPCCPFQRAKKISYSSSVNFLMIVMCCQMKLEEADCLLLTKSYLLLLLLLRSFITLYTAVVPIDWMQKLNGISSSCTNHLLVDLK